MKKMRITVLVAVSLLALTAFAQQQSPQPPEGGVQGGVKEGVQGGQRQGGPRGPSIEELTEKLSLSTDQQGKVKIILDDLRTQMQSLRQNESLPQEERREKGRSLREAANSKIRDLLTGDQKKKFEEMQKENQDRMRQRQQGGGDMPK